MGMVPLLGNYKKYCIAIEPCLLCFGKKHLYLLSLAKNVFCMPHSVSTCLAELVVHLWVAFLSGAKLVILWAAWLG